MPLNIDDFDRVSAKTPLLCDLKPGGKFVATDVFAAGGTAVVAKRLLEAGLLNADEITVSGRHDWRGSARSEGSAGQPVIRPLSDPIKPTGGLVILKGNLAAGRLRIESRGPQTHESSRSRPCV